MEVHKVEVIKWEYKEGDWFGHNSASTDYGIDIIPAGKNTGFVVVVYFTIKNAALGIVFDSEIKSLFTINEAKPSEKTLFKCIQQAYEQAMNVFKDKGRNLIELKAKDALFNPPQLKDVSDIIESKIKSRLY